MTKSGLLTWLKMGFLPPIGAWVIRTLGWAIRVRTEGSESVDDLYRQGKRLIIAFWHGRQLMMPLAYRGTEAYILISQHRDGELIHQIVSRFGFQSVRGSTTRGGVPALRHLIQLGRAGVDLVVTPDGPRGPCQVAQVGTVQLAKATGLPIVPLTFSCSKKKSFAVGIISWSPIRSAGASSSGETRFGSSAIRRRSTLKRSAVSWRQP